MKNWKKNDLSFRGVIKTLVGIDSEYSRGDRILAWSVFFYSIVWGFGSWLVAVIWNILDPWPIHYWANWFFLFNYILAGAVGSGQILSGSLLEEQSIYGNCSGIWLKKNLMQKRTAESVINKNLLLELGLQPAPVQQHSL